MLNVTTDQWISTDTKFIGCRTHPRLVRWGCWSDLEESGRWRPPCLEAWYSIWKDGTSILSPLQLSPSLYRHIIQLWEWPLFRMNLMRYSCEVSLFMFLVIITTVNEMSGSLLATIYIMETNCSLHHIFLLGIYLNATRRTMETFNNSQESEWWKVIKKLIAVLLKRPHLHYKIPNTVIDFNISNNNLV